MGLVNLHMDTGLPAAGTLNIYGMVTIVL